jgi:hypothetical protein
VKFTWNIERYENAGSVNPASFELAPGASRAVTVQFRMPNEPGDSPAALRFGQSGPSSGITSAEIPLSRRTLIPIKTTGGNGQTNGAPTQTFAFDVPPGVRDMTLALALSDSGYLLEGLLIDPQGMPLSIQRNFDPLGNPQAALQLSRFNPQPGRWRFILVRIRVAAQLRMHGRFASRSLPAGCSAYRGQRHPIHCSITSPDRHGRAPLFRL